MTNQLRRTDSGGTCRLLVISGPDAGKQFTLPQVGVVLGAGATADVRLNDASVSGRHCTITPKPEGFAVCDLESRNGTLLDGVGIAKALVPVGAVSTSAWR